MTNFDFHNLLFPTEFENLCRDILEIRENPIKFTSYKPGKDGGIDFKSTNTEDIIIGQCKLYNPNNYNGLKRSLKKEVEKCQKKKPNRYILCVGMKLSDTQAEEILELFKGYILNQNDIIDNEKLNKYLGNKEYNYLKKIYSKLLIPNLSYVEDIISNTVNSKYYKSTKSFLLDINEKHKLFHNVFNLKTCIDILEDKKVLILTGNPGVGKTTMAKMIVNYFIGEKLINNIFFVSDNHLQDIEGLLIDNQKQLIVVDDFWGQNFSPTYKNNTRLRNFTRIINDFKKSSSHYLILTSREYIIRDVISNAEYETREILNTDSFTINLNEYSEEDKARIFLNHLYFYNFEKKYISHLKYNDQFQRIVNHSNYSPRNIEYFCKTQLKENNNEYSFYKELEQYFEKPNEYWNKNFIILNNTSQLILLIILISSDPISLTDLETTFEEVQSDVRKELNLNINPLDFANEIRLLEDFYIISEKQECSSQILIRFQNPGIKDYLLEYLRIDGRTWIRPLIKNVPFFNQLIYVFDTIENQIDDFESDIPLYGKKIVLSKILQEILKEKLLEEFDLLNFCTQDAREYTNDFTTGFTSEETKYFKISQLNDLFKISQNSNIDVRKFIINEVMKDIDNYQEGHKIVDQHSMTIFPSIIKLIHSFIDLDENKLIQHYYNGITFTNEYYSFYEFIDIYPFEFNKFYAQNILKIRTGIKYQILDDIDYYKWHEMDLKLDSHLGYIIEEVAQLYGIRLTSKFVLEIEEIAERPFRNFKKNRTKESAKENTVREKIKSNPLDKIVDEYLSPIDTYENEFNLKSYLGYNCNDKNLIKFIIKEVKNEKSILKPFTTNKDILDSFINLFNSKVLNYENLSTFTILNELFTNWVVSKNLNPEILKEKFYNLSTSIDFSYDYSISESQLKKEFTNIILNFSPTILSPLIIPHKKWYIFSQPDIRIYFIAEYIKTIKDDEIFKENVFEYLCDFQDTLIEILNISCFHRLKNTIIIPELKKFITSIDITSEKSTILSFIDFFKIEFNLKWNQNKKKFGDSGSSNSEWYIELFLNHLDIEFSIMNLDIYFLKDYHTNEDIQKYFLNKNAYNKLYNIITKTIEKKKRRCIFSEEIGIYFDIGLYEFAKNDENYYILKQIGMIDYIFDIYTKSQIAISNYTNQS
ncbi:nSTAND3 domain-containing NTPase [Flavobacterium cerinum]|uniref:Novel STAND NTPase 3 domain-containing protein n=1 Tax=Flavobacterium cerinum TaxID=2502784 RepID=A0A3S3QS76_9FLAO|nr:hypothetical protein [Flavobacterium cerinum]RWX00253.1 hypothetical protein EPI11_10270 [Flavobacterium cerinum]